MSEKIIYLKMMRGSEIQNISHREDGTLLIGFEDFLLEVRESNLHVAPFLEKIEAELDWCLENI